MFYLYHLQPACSVRHIMVCWGITFCWILPWSVNKERKTCEISTNSERRRIHPIDSTRKKISCVMSKSRALICAICVSFLIFSHLHLSFVNLNNKGMRVIMWWYKQKFFTTSKSHLLRQKIRQRISVMKTNCLEDTKNTSVYFHYWDSLTDFLTWSLFDVVKNLC